MILNTKTTSSLCTNPITVDILSSILESRFTWVELTVIDALSPTFREKQLQAITIKNILRVLKPLIPVSKDVFPARSNDF